MSELLSQRYLHECPRASFVHVQTLLNSKPSLHTTDAQKTLTGTAEVAGCVEICRMMQASSYQCGLFRLEPETFLSGAGAGVAFCKASSIEGFGLSWHNLRPAWGQSRSVLRKHVGCKVRTPTPWSGR
jgi:hypothetical protein